MTGDSTTGWNVNTLKEYFDKTLIQLEIRLQQRFDAQQQGVNTAMIAAEKAVNAALIAAEKAVDKAETAQSQRNEQQNEFRGTLSDLSKLMWTRTEGEASVEALRRELTARVLSVERQMADADARIADRLGKLEKDGATQADVHAQINETIAARASLATRLTSLEGFVSNLQGRLWALSVGLTVLTIVIGVGLHFIN